MTSRQLKTRRKNLELSQFAVAKFANVSRYKISLFESGYGKLTPMEQERIDQFLIKGEASHGTGYQKVKSE